MSWFFGLPSIDGPVSYFLFGSLVFAAANALLIILLITRRIWLAHREEVRLDREDALRPITLKLIDGESQDLSGLSRTDVAILAGLLARYAEQLSGVASENITRFFEQHGYVQKELSALKSRRSWRRARAAHALGGMGSMKAAQQLLLAINDRKREVRTAAARSLGKLGVEQAVQPLITSLTDGRVPYITAAQALLEIGPSALPRLRNLLLRGEENIQTASIELVGRIGDASDSPTLISFMSDPSAENRAKSAQAMGRLGAEDSAAELRIALKDSDPSVRAAAATSLGEIGDKGSVGLLFDQAQTDEFQAAQAAARAVAELDPDRLAIAAENRNASSHILENADLLKAR